MKSCPRTRNNLWKYLVLFFLCLFVLPVEGFSQKNIRINKLKNEDGLSNNTVFSIIQDNEGYIWLGTKEGLNCYDGYNFKVYYPDLFDSTSISDTWINYLYIDSKGLIWIGTAEGELNCFDKKTGKFKKFSHNCENANGFCCDEIFTITEDRYSNIWIGTDNGISVLDASRKNFRTYRNDPSNPNSLSDNTVYELFFDSKQKLWVGTNGGGLDLFDSKTGDFKHFKHNPRDKSTILGDEIWFIKQDLLDENRIWIATHDGLNSLDISTNTFTPYLNRTNSNNLKADNTLQTLLVDSKNRIWMGTETRGVFLLDPQTGKTSHYFHSDNSSGSLSGNDILSLYEDRTGLIWVGTTSYGVNILVESNFNLLKINSSDSTNIRTNKVNSVCENGPDIWIGTGDGLLKYNKTTETLYKYPSNQGNKSLKDNNVYILFVDRDEDLWIGTSDGGLNMLPKNSSTFRYFACEPSNNTSISDNSVEAITQDKNGILWIGTGYEGLCSLNKSTGRFTRYQHDPANPNSLSGNKINDLIVDNDNNLWIALSGSGLNKYDIKNNRFTSYQVNKSDITSLNDIFVESLYQSNDSTLWVGTYYGGLNRLNTRTGKFLHFTQLDGLPSNQVNAIREDSKHNIWISTNLGISRFNPITGHFKNYNITNGLPQLEYTKCSVFKGSSGTLFFGGTSGLTYFTPEDITERSYIPTVRIIDFLIFDQSVRYNPEISLKLPFTDKEVITLNHNQSSVTFIFSSFLFSNSVNTHYTYILEGYDNQWINSGSNIAKYSNLPPGTYLFKVKGANSDGIWNETPTLLTLVITPPYWKTRWFYALILCLSIGLIVLTIKLRERNLRNSQRKLAEKVKEITTEIHQQNKEILAQRDYVLRQKTLIEEQNIELIKHRTGLEQLVHERTAELEIAKKKAEESDKMKSSFLANMSHEIRTPMNVIVGFSSLLVDQETTDEQKIEYAQYISNSGNTLLGLIDDILNISLIESGKLKLSKLNCNIDKQLSELYDVFQKKLTILKNTEITLTLESDPAHRGIVLYTDPIRLTQVLTNLLDNAIKFTEKGSVSFGYELLDEEGKQCLRFHVRDTGIGLTEKQCSQLFMRFSRVSESMDKIYRGTGLGLSICKDLVDLFGGEIWVDSEPGTGSVFYFTHPYNENEEGDKPNRGIDVLKNDFLLNKRILVAEDEIMNFKLLESMLLKRGAVVLHAADGIEVTEIVSTTPVDLILMDLNMPRLGGYEAIKIIRQSHPDLPIIAQTASAYESDRDISLQAGCNAYISKPINRYELMELINRLLPR
jgi:signal transduction histidine kinase/ligand-binding sensor domain-containing protein/CheY-like chemotaxis protein